jgi:hypothetical protein
LALLSYLNPPLQRLSMATSVCVMAFRRRDSLACRVTDRTISAGVSSVLAFTGVRSCNAYQIKDEDK